MQYDIPVKLLQRYFLYHKAVMREIPAHETVETLSQVFAQYLWL